MRNWFLLFSLLACTASQANEAPAELQLPVKAWAVLDHDSGQLLASHNADARLEPASLTKLMTAYVVFDALRQKQVRLEDLVTVSKRAWKQGYVRRESRMFIELGSQVSVADLLRGLIVQSGNDASIALAEHVSGSVESFVARMNQTAKTLGMTESHFTNPNGVHHAELLTSAKDLALLARALIGHFPEHYALFGETEFTYNGIAQRNRNRLLGRVPGVDGLKTGHHKRAGYCIVSSALRDGRRVISVVLGAKTPPQRLKASHRLLEYGYQLPVIRPAPAKTASLTPPAELQPRL